MLLHSDSGDKDDAGLREDIAYLMKEKSMTFQDAFGFAFVLLRNWQTRPVWPAWLVGRCLILKPKPALLILLKPAKCK